MKLGYGQAHDFALDKKQLSIRTILSCGSRQVGLIIVISFFFILFLRSMLQLGSSQPWPDAMEQITGQRDIKADAIMEYFSPLNTWLQEQNKLMDEQIGWEEGMSPPCFIEMVQK